MTFLPPDHVLLASHLEALSLECEPTIRLVHDFLLQCGSKGLFGENSQAAFERQEWDVGFFIQTVDLWRLLNDDTPY